MEALTLGRLHATIVLACGLLLTLPSCAPTPPTLEPDTAIDLIQQDWQHTPGVVKDGDELHVAATSLSIVEQDGGRGQPNPPLNLAGTHLIAEGDFTLSASLADVSADATWSIYDTPPVIADEFRIEPASLRLTLRDEKILEIMVFDGSTPQDVTDTRPAHHERATLSDPEAPLSIHRSANTLTVNSGGNLVSSIPMGAIFESGKLWLGLSSNNGSFHVHSLTATAPHDAEILTARPTNTSATQTPDGLQALTNRIRPGFTIGAAVALGPLASDADYAQELVGNFGAMTPENAMKPQALSPQQGVYTFGDADALLAIAESHNMAVHGHTIAFTEAMPQWMQELPTNTGTERQESAKALLDYVNTVATHFKGRLQSWDVVNEPFDVAQGTSLQNNIWYRVFGPAYPVVVSQAVHDADPNVKQFINENGADVPGERQDALLKLALDTNTQGGYISGVGLQAHVYDLDTDAITADDLTNTLTLFGDAGLQVRISENDVTDDHGTQAQAEQYATILGTCLPSPTCISYTTWGVDDRYNWWTDHNGNLQQGHDYLFNHGQPTPAYKAIKRVLEK